MSVCEDCGQRLQQFRLLIAVPAFILGGVAVALAGCEAGVAPPAAPAAVTTTSPEEAGVRYVFVERAGNSDLVFKVDGKAFNELDLGTYFREHRVEWPVATTQLRVVYDGEVPLAWFSHSCRRFRYFGFENARCLAGGGSSGRATEIREMGPSVLLPEPGWPRKGEAGNVAQAGTPGGMTAMDPAMPDGQDLAGRLLRAILSGDEATIRGLFNGREVDATEMSWLIGGPEVRFGYQGDRKSARQVLMGGRVLTRVVATEQADGATIVEAVFLPERTAGDFGTLLELENGNEARRFRDYVMCEFVLADGRAFMRNVCFADTDVFDD